MGGGNTNLSQVTYFSPLDLTSEKKNRALDDCETDPTAEIYILLLVSKVGRSLIMFLNEVNVTAERQLVHLAKRKGMLVIMRHFNVPKHFTGTPINYF